MYHRYPRWSQILKDDFDDDDDNDDDNDGSDTPPAKVAKTVSEATVAAALDHEDCKLQWQTCLYCSKPGLQTALVYCAVCGRRQPNPYTSSDIYVAAIQEHIKDTIGDMVTHLASFQSKQ